MREWEEEILSQMDAGAAGYNFPMLNNAYLRGAGIRLDAFSNPSEWLVVFQELAVSEKHGLVNAVSAYGNRLAKPGLQEFVPLTGPPPDEGEGPGLDPWDFTLSIRGRARRFTPGAADYEAAGVDPEADNVPTSAKILRLLAAQMPDELYLSDDELLEVCGRAGAGLKKFLRLEDWHHPDIADDEMPSASPCLRSLAHALALNDAGLYECPEADFNTHWSRWEDIYDEMP